MCSATTGNRGSYVETREETARRRLSESRRAAELIGARPRTLGLSDCEVNAADPAQRSLVVDLVRELDPELILTHSPNDYVGDHNELAKLVFDCSFYATLPLLETELPHVPTVAPIVYLDTVFGLGFTPTEYVDVTAVMDVKVAMLEAHRSQLAWLREHDGIDVVEQMRVATRYRGLQCGVEYAEGFVPCHAWRRIVPRRLLP